MREIYLENLPRYSSGANKGKINWFETTGHKCKFIYDEIIGEVEIIGYDSKMVELKYNSNIFKIGNGHFINCEFAVIVGNISMKHTYKVGDFINGLEILDKTNGGSKKPKRTYTTRCIKDGYVNHHVLESTLKRGGGCPVCASRITIKGFNDISTTHQELVKYFINVEDTYKYSYASNKKLLMMCPDCGNIKKCTPNYLSGFRFPCNQCGDGYSYPNKFIFNLLSQLKVDFIPEYCDNWTDNKKFDNYVPSIDTIIENHGMFHYEDCPIRGARNLEEEKENDTYKEKLAKDNGIKHYIVLDCRKSELEWIKNSIMQSELPNIMKFKEEDIDWLKCHEYACGSRVKEICDLWNNGVQNVTEISKITRYGVDGIRTYLKKGNSLGWCNYDGKEVMRNNGLTTGKAKAKPLIMYKDGEAFGEFESATWLEKNSIELFGEKLHQASISDVCTGKQNKYKGYTFVYK